jgi:hypothetical protein
MGAGGVRSRTAGGGRRHLFTGEHVDAVDPRNPRSLLSRWPFLFAMRAAAFPADSPPMPIREDFADRLANPDKSTK